MQTVSIHDEPTADLRSDSSLVATATRPTLDPLRAAENDRRVWRDRAMSAEAQIGALQKANDALAAECARKDRDLAMAVSECKSRAAECADLRVDNEHLRLVLEAAVLLVIRNTRDGRAFDDALSNLQKVAIGEQYRRTAKRAVAKEEI